MMFASASAFAWGGGNERSNGPTRTHIYSLGMSCAAVQNAVAANGAVILHYGDGLYERVVADGSYCSHAAGETTEPFWAPSADTSACFSGYTCEMRDSD
jgi:hypothetical protein